MTTLVNDIAKITLSTPFAVGDVNVYLVKGDALTLVDAGPLTDTAWVQLTEQLSILGYTPGDIEQIVLTHHHPDHAGLLDRFPSAVTVYGHRYNRFWLHRDARFHEVYDRFFMQLAMESGLPEVYRTAVPKFKSPLKFMGDRKLDVEIGEGDSVPGMEGWSIIETLGHAQSHLSFYRERDGVLIAGDHILATISPNPLIEPPFEGETGRPKPMLEYNASLKKLLDYPISIAYTGHGADVTDVHGLIPKRLRKQDERAKGVLEMIKGNRVTVFEICKALFPSVYQKELGLTLSETIGQLDYLESLQFIRKEKLDGIYYYFA
ncbi:MBL fold metallo-hydrolase [Bacillus sp. AFS015802]|uniref:MBL fold metallo-hydrolase n=1 Tax=Bacillus sp. AFS015802 TaxID=2033486 RepID=UPI000BF9409C|nr:MBL fold metallo-hydrolase [Bacillus sp. AFS015802]PFA63951.1 MBL fold metallo-hydrolase [Bacillus sp. AFS015802]